MPEPLPYNASRCVKAASVQTMRAQSLHQYMQEHLNGEDATIRPALSEAEKLLAEALLIMRYALDGEIPEPMQDRIRTLAKEYGR